MAVEAVLCAGAAHWRYFGEYWYLNFLLTAIIVSSYFNIPFYHNFDVKKKKRIQVITLLLCFILLLIFIFYKEISFK